MTSTRALVAERDGDEIRCRVGELAEDDLGEGDVVIRVECSGVNYKDALAVQPKGGVARISPLVPGVDLAGVVETSATAGLSPGDPVIVHGYGLGVSHHGGFATRARVPAEWVVRRPEGLTAREAMIVGTAGFTAALSIDRLERAGLVPGDQPVVVTGATGGVGCCAVAMLARTGHRVVASTGKEDAAEWLRSLGADEVIGREELSGPGKPLDRQRWAAGVDCVGGATLAGVLRSVQYGGAVAASGLTGGAKLETTVLPFILRSVSLLGVDSVEVPPTERSALWARIASDLRPPDLQSLVAGEVGLDEVTTALDALATGGARGRYLVVPG